MGGTGHKAACTKYTREDFAVANRLPFGGEVRVGRLEHDSVEDAAGRLLHYGQRVEEVKVYTVDVEERPTDMLRSLAICGFISAQVSSR